MSGHGVVVGTVGVVNTSVDMSGVDPRSVVDTAVNVVASVDDSLVNEMSSVVSGSLEVNEAVTVVGSSVICSEVPDCGVVIVSFGVIFNDPVVIFNGESVVICDNNFINVVEFGEDGPLLD